MSNNPLIQISQGNNIYQDISARQRDYQIRNIYHPISKKKISKSATYDEQFSEQLELVIHPLQLHSVQIKYIEKQQQQKCIEMECEEQNKNISIEDWLKDKSDFSVIYHDRKINKQLTFAELAQNACSIELIITDKQIENDEICITVYKQGEPVHNDVVKKDCLIMNEINYLYKRPFYILSNNQIIQEGQTFRQVFGNQDHCKLFFLEYQSILQENHELEVSIVEYGEIVGTKLINKSQNIMNALEEHFNKIDYFVYHKGLEVQTEDTFSSLFTNQLSCCLVIESKVLYYQEQLKALERLKERAQKELSGCRNKDLKLQYTKKNEYYFEREYNENFISKFKKDLLYLQELNVADVTIQNKKKIQIQPLVEIQNKSDVSEKLDEIQIQNVSDIYDDTCGKCEKSIMGNSYFQGKCTHCYHDSCILDKLKSSMNKQIKLKIQCYSECATQFTMRDLRLESQIKGNQIHEKAMSILLNQLFDNFKPTANKQFAKCQR